MGPLAKLTLVTLVALSLCVARVAAAQDAAGMAAPVPQDANSAPPITDPPVVDAPPPDTTPPVVTPPAHAPPTAAQLAADAEEARYEHDLRQRTDIAKIHRVLGISTWISMGVTLLFGGIQYHNLYGDFADISHNPCTTGQGIIFGPDQCHGVPWLHAITEGVTSLLYFSTFTLSLLMPDPDHSDQGNSEFANKMRWHKALRWVHLIGMIAQLGLGFIMANANLDRANNYDTLQGLATTHMAIGILTYVALSAAGALMVF